MGAFFLLKLSEFSFLSRFVGRLLNELVAQIVGSSLIYI